MKQLSNTITEYLPGLFLVDLDQQLTGFRSFISSWICKTNEVCFVVDPGPLSTHQVLLDALDSLNIDRIDYILLTHIHIDHAGSSGQLVKSFPEAVVVCHPKGIEHLINPEKLWHGSLKVLGDMARAYGEIVPVPEKNIMTHPQESGSSKIEVIETPGHAPHHRCYLFKEILFAGEAAGVNIPVSGGVYQRIATPPRFIYDVYFNSLKKASITGAEKIAFAHYGLRPDAENVFQTAFQQLEFWMNTVKAHYKKGNNYSGQQLLLELLQTDPALNMFSKLDSDLQEREKSFCLNSIRGMYEFMDRQTV